MSVVLNAQTGIERGWAKLDSADVFGAIDEFQDAAKDKNLSADAHLGLAILYDKVDRDADALNSFVKYYEESDNPMPILHPLLYEKFIINRGEIQTKCNDEIHERLIADPRSKGKIRTSLYYNLAYKNFMQFNPELGHSALSKINSVDTWSYLGPFDNYMNNGFTKDHGALSHPESGVKFESRYGASITWFNSELDNLDGYQASSSKFNDSKCVVYAQSFIDVQNDLDVILNLAYTGTLKIWLNDQLLYSESNQRMTAADEYQLSTKLKKGTNRVLVQLGDYDSDYPNFMVRFTDQYFEPVDVKYSSEYKAYDKSKVEFELLPHHSINYLAAMLKKDPSNVLYNWLLAKTYIRRGDKDSAETHLKSAEKDHPNNFLIVRELNMLYGSMGNLTEQNKYYEKFKFLYPESKEVLEEDIEEYVNVKDQENLLKTIGQYSKLYRGELSKIICDIHIATINEDYPALIDLVEKTYSVTNRSNESFESQYKISKAVGGGVAARKLLEEHLKDRYLYSKIRELAIEYLDNGEKQKAFDLMDRALAVTNEATLVYKDIANLHFKEKKYDEALDIYEYLSRNRPTDYSLLNEIAMLHNFRDDKESAHKYHERSLTLYPFDFGRNEKMREAKGKKNMLSSIEYVDAQQAILDYKNGNKRNDVRDYDVLYNKSTLLVNKHGARATVLEYLIKITTESAIESFQRINFQSDQGMTMNVLKAQTIKSNGNAINAESYGNERVFTNLEVGDFLYVSIKQTQTWGSKITKFWTESFGFTYYQPCYNAAFELVTEGEVPLNIKLVNGEVDYHQKTDADLIIKTWSVETPSTASSELVSLEHGDQYPTLYVGSKNEWVDVVNWYNDLSSEQIKGDFTIKTILKDLEIKVTDDDHDKAKKIYDFIVQNIQYSSIDFRQSGIIPQKASDIYHTRLGDCKDVSTLYTALGREAGLDVHLVLINTSNNGYNSVVLPGIDFNHCIVNVTLDGIPTYLELTDPYLPFGQLDTYHYKASVLHIDTNAHAELKRIEIDSNDANTISRNKEITISDEDEMHVNLKSQSSGAEGSRVTATYLQLNTDDQKESLENSLSSDYNGTLKIDSFDFSKLVKGSPVAYYSYSYTVSNELNKVGSFKSLKLPLSDLLVNHATFQVETRETPLNYPMYEYVDKYVEDLTIRMEGVRKILEKPEDITLSYDGMHYQIQFELLQDGKLLKVKRVFEPVRKIISPEDYKQFRTFMLGVHESETVHLIIK